MEEIIELIAGIFTYWQYILAVLCLSLGIVFIAGLGTTAGIISGITLILTAIFLVYLILKNRNS